MNGVHDLGGMHGFGPVEPEPDEPVFHSEWERRAFAVTLSTGFLGQWNIDQSRHAREVMPPAEYLATSYYEHWLFGLEARAAHIRHGKMPAPPAEWKPASGHRVVRPGDVEKLLSTGNPFRVNEDIPARFHVGDAVRTHNDHPLGHTRLPRYARARRGQIAIDHGVFVFPDAHAAGQGKKPQHCYSVRFEARELWGSSAPASEFVHIDLWDDYLEPA
jgi:nitrile hydratase